MTNPAERLVLFYLVRGADDHYLDSVTRFVRAYQACPAGIDHDLVVIFKGFASADALEEALAALGPVAFEAFHTGDDSFDLGAYADAVMNTRCERACFLNTSSEPRSTNWLLKLNAALDLSGVGLVGATGSFEGGVAGEAFPNVHVRTNAFMMRAALARRTLGKLKIASKRDAHLAEHGPDGLTRQVTSLGRSVVVVGANGRAYAPEWWAGSRTFRQGGQANLLVNDNQTRVWDALAWPERKLSYDATWGAARTPGTPFGAPLS